jgi:hypothetical protein
MDIAVALIAVLAIAAVALVSHRRATRKLANAEPVPMRRLMWMGPLFVAMFFAAQLIGGVPLVTALPATALFAGFFLYYVSRARRA